jgi:hypothetical protein
VNCGLCGEWAHFGCDRRQGLGTFKVKKSRISPCCIFLKSISLISRSAFFFFQDYAKTDGLEYICPHCSLANYKKKPPPPKVANGFANTASVPRNV